MRTRFMAAAALAVMISAPAHAQMQSQEFVTQAASGNLLEIESSRMALERSQHEGIRDFAQHMIEDHTAATERLQAVASQEGLQVPASMVPKHAQQVEQLSQAQDNFDGVYAGLQLQAHQEMIALFESYASGGDNEALQAFATETLPTLQEHQAHISQLTGEAAPAAQPSQ